MRPSRSHLATIALGLGVLVVAAAKSLHVGRTAFALFVAPAILIELFEESDRDRIHEPTHQDRFSLDSLDQLGLALAIRPRLDGRGRQSAEALETVTNPGDLVVARLNEG